MQGTLTVTFTEWVRVRLIPAHTGNTYGDYLRVLALPAHPRAYGERTPRCPKPTGPFGSPPCIRGTPKQPQGRLRGNRLTPAHTGNAFTYSWTVSPRTAHPRAYREYCAAASISCFSLGSSPRIQGIHVIADFSATMPRLIPAHTGNTPYCRSYCHRLSAHPRAYREYTQPQVAIPKQSLKIIYFPHVYIGDE